MAPRPNVLLVVTDQQRPDLFGAAGRVAVRTPATDRLAAEGTTFSRAYVACPVCTPSRATLLSGQYPSRHGAWSVGVATPADVTSLPRLLAEGAGYRSAIVGKSHFRPCLDPASFEAPPHSQDWAFFRDWEGPWYGFERARISVGHAYEPHGYAMHYGLWLQERGVPLAPPYFMPAAEAQALNLGTSWALPEEYHSSRWVADETIACLQEYAGAPDRPFYLCVNFPDPHPPFVVPAPWDHMYDDAALPPPVRRANEWEGKPRLYQATIDRALKASGWYTTFPPADQRVSPTLSEDLDPREQTWWRGCLGMQSLLDHHLGRVLAQLDALGLTENTLVVLTSDHGDYMGDHFLWAKGGSHYDGAVRVPFIVRWPGHVPAGVVSPALQSLVDFGPTVMAAAGLRPAAAMQGIDQLPAWRGSAARCREGVWIDHRVESGLQVDTWITEQYRLSAYSDLAHHTQETELYDLARDPAEFDNLAARPAYQPLVVELLSQLLRHREEVGGPWLPRTSYA
jgi:arylsulfatase A-like enzyme